MKIQSALLLFLMLTLGAPAAAQGLPLSSPEAQGVSSRGILRFIEAAESEVDALHGMVLLRHGKVIAQGWWTPFDRHSPHMLYSLSKSFTSTAIGFAVDEGKLSVDDRVLSFFPNDAPAEPGEYLKAMRVRDLLTMTTGHAKDTLAALTRSGEKNWARVFLSLPVEYEPGTHFLYNTGATYMLSAILQKVTGQTLLDYLKPRLFEPLGIEKPAWETDPRGISVGGWGLKITTMDIAKLGQLYLQKGIWEGRRLLSESWVTAATSAQVPNGSNSQSDWNQGYGYQFWRSRHNTYRADGAMSQFCIVMPGTDAVLAITAGHQNMQQVLDLVWEHLLPAMTPDPIPPDEQAQIALTKKLETLSHPVIQGELTSPLAANLSGKRFTLDKNDVGMEAVSFDFGRGGDRVTVHAASGEQRFELGQGDWRKQVIPFSRLGLPVVATDGPEAVAASGAWVEPDRYVLRTWLYETPYRLEMEFDFDPDAMTVVVHRRLHPLQSQPTQIKGATNHLTDR